MACLYAAHARPPYVETLSWGHGYRYLAIQFKESYIKEDYGVGRYGLSTDVAWTYGLLFIRRRERTSSQHLVIRYDKRSVEAVNPLLADYNGEELTGVKYRHYTAVLTKAVQELKAGNDQLKIRIEALEATLKKQKK